MLHYNPRHVSSINMPIFRWTNCIITASGIVTLCKWLYTMQQRTRLCALCTQLASRLFNITTATTGQKTIGSETQSDLLMMDVKTPETC